jgi:hypothetical protein
MIIISLFLFTSCDDTPRKSRSSNSVDKWYIGGNLHKSKVIEWKNATEKNKLATCGDFIAGVVDKSTSLDVIKRKAENLKICIDEATINDSENDKAVAKIASLCTITLGY